MGTWRFTSSITVPLACHELASSALDERSSLAAAEATEAAAMAVLAAARWLAGTAMAAGMAVVLVVRATGSAATTPAAETEPTRSGRRAVRPR